MSVWHKKRKQDPAEINTEFKHVQGDATWKSYYLHPRYYPRQCAFKPLKKKRKHPQNVWVSPFSTRISKNSLTCTRLIALHSFL